MPLFTTTDGVEIEYESRGDSGPALMLVPGLSMGAWHWHRQFALADRHRVVAMSPRGHGRSGRDEGGYTLAQVARDVHDLIEFLDLRDVTLVGWSMGSFVAFEYVAAFGHQHLRGLCSVDMTPRNTRDEQWEHAVFGDLDMAKVVAASGKILHNRVGWQRGLSVACFASGAPTDDTVLDGWTREGLSASTGSVLSYWIDLANSDWRPLMPELSLPTLIVHGAKSLACPTDVGSWMERAIPASRLCMFAESGHAPFWEEPERFNAEVARFVAGT